MDIEIFKNKISELNDNQENKVEWLNKNLPYRRINLRQKIEMADVVKHKMETIFDIFPDDYKSIYIYYYAIKYLAVVAFVYDLDLDKFFPQNITDYEEYFDVLDKAGLIDYINNFVFEDKTLEIIDNYCEIFNIQAANSFYYGLELLAQELNQAVDMENISQYAEDLKFFNEE